MNARKITVLVLMVVLALVALAACQPEPEEVIREVTRVITETVEVEGEVQEVTRIVTEEETVEVEVTRVVEVEEEEPPAEPMDRNGAWVDTVVVVEEPNADAAVTRLETGDLDIYAYSVSSPETAAQIAQSEALETSPSFGSYNELTFNPAACTDGRLNPFTNPQIREAMNWVVDRDFIVSEIMGGLGVPRYVPVGAASADRGRFAAAIRQIELEYAFDLERGREVISAQMEEMGATLEDGVWTADGEPVELTVLIRTEDERQQIGDYVANQLEDLGFTVVRDYRTVAEASPIWYSGDPTECLFHVYTGGWISTAISRDSGWTFETFYTSSGLSSPLWQAYTPTEEYAALGRRLANNDFTTLEERAELFREALDLALEDSVRIWLLDRQSVTPYRQELSVASDLSGAVYGTYLWAPTLRREGEVGGSIDWAMPSILSEPWNPVAGSNWIYDAGLQRGMSQLGTFPDPNTGLELPNRIESATVTVQEDLPVAKTLDWVELVQEPEITVPDDALVDWDAEAQEWITAADAYTETETAALLSTVVYPSGFDGITWHDGSAFDAADIMMEMIMTFDRAKEASAIYDEAYVPDFQSFQSAFKGWRITNEDPLTIEYYTDNWQLDAENGVATLWPEYGFGEAPWHTMALGNLVEQEGLASYSSDKSTANEVDWISFIAGPTIELLSGQLETAASENFVPYAPTMSQWVSEEEAAERYANLQEWFRRRGHFWVNTGPFFLQRAFPVEGTVILERYPDFPDAADKWARFAEPAIPQVEVDGPGRVTQGEAATFDIFVDFNELPYAMEDIQEVQYLVFDATGALAEQGAAEGVEDGLWQVSLSEDLTSGLEAGSNRLEVVVVSRLVAIPSVAGFQFVTAP